MKKNLFSAYDREAGFYYPPFVSNDSPEACLAEHQRTILINREISIKNRLHLCDLYLLGTFDDQSGEIVLEAKPNFVGHLEDPLNHGTN